MIFFSEAQTYATTDCHFRGERNVSLSGDKNKAQAAYREFLTLWKDADSGIPILKEAKAESAKLQ